MSARAIREVMQDADELPEGVEGQLVAQRIDQWLMHELDGKRLFAADYDDGVAIVVLENDTTAMYRVRAPHTVA
jgi:hypothetical protein